MMQTQCIGHIHCHSQFEQLTSDNAAKLMLLLGLVLDKP